MPGVNNSKPGYPAPKTVLLTGQENETLPSTTFPSPSCPFLSSPLSKDLPFLLSSFCCLPPLQISGRRGEASPSSDGSVSAFLGFEGCVAYSAEDSGSHLSTPPKNLLLLQHHHPPCTYQRQQHTSSILSLPFQTERMKDASTDRLVVRVGRVLPLPHRDFIGHPRWARSLHGGPHAALPFVACSPRLLKAWHILRK